MSGRETSERTREPANRIPEQEAGRDLRDAVITRLQAQARLNRAKIDNLEMALQTARRIGAAVGILMATQHATEEQAFEMLRVCSNHTCRKLREIADEVVTTGSMPAPASS